MKNFTLLLLAGMLAGSSAFADATKADCKSEEHYPLIDRAQLASVVEKKEAFVIDVNSADSFKTLHVPGAIHYADHKKDFAKQLPESKDALIVAYCGGPQCTAWRQAAERACKLGYTNIKHFKGGITGWKEGT